MWRNPDKDAASRRVVVEQVTKLLRARKPDAPPEWMQRLPEMAERLERKLYDRAPSLAEYLNESTLKARLQAIASEMRADMHPGGHPREPAPPPAANPQPSTPSLGTASRSKSQRPTDEPPSPAG